MLGTVRGRLVTLLLLVAVAGPILQGLDRYLPDWVGQHLPYCSRLPMSLQNSCEAVSFLPVTSFWMLVFSLVVLALISRPLSRWVLRPVSALLPTIAQVGPQNLGHRISPASRRRDAEFVALARAIDQMTDRLAAGYESQRRFAANASHELRTPLAVQRTLIEVGMTGPLTRDQQDLLAGQLLRTNERNERLIEGLLVLAEADDGLVARQAVRLDEVAAEVVSAQADRAKAADVTLSQDLAPHLVLGERVLLERLITNLVQNAVTYNRPGGTVHVQVGGPDTVIVQNTGGPVPAEAIPRLFEPFQRLGADRMQHGGAGLGLAIARSITRAHDGSIGAVPGIDGGLRVTVSLP